jgi:hypothetical protein
MARARRVWFVCDLAGFGVLLGFEEPGLVGGGCACRLAGGGA